MQTPKALPSRTLMRAHTCLTCKLQCKALLVSTLMLCACAQCVGGVAAGLMAGPLYGTGATWLKKMLPWIRPTEEPTGENNELQDQTGNARELEMQAPLYEAKPTSGAKKTFVQDEGNIIV